MSLPGSGQPVGHQLRRPVSHGQGEGSGSDWHRTHCKSVGCRGGKWEGVVCVYVWGGGGGGLSTALVHNTTFNLTLPYTRHLISVMGGLSLACW